RRLHPGRRAGVERGCLSEGRAGRSVRTLEARGRRPALDHAPPMLTLAYPWLLAGVPLPLAVWWLAPPYREHRQGLRGPFRPRLARLTGQEPTAGAVVLRGNWLRLVVIIGVWLCVVAALVRPQWLEPPVSRTIPVRDLMLAVDLSGSMETKDFADPSGKTVDRLTAVKQVLDDFLTRRKGDRVGLLVFGHAP